MPLTYKTQFQETLSQYLTNFYTSFTFYHRGEKIVPSIERFLAAEPNKDNALAVYDAFLETYLTPGLRKLSDQMREFEEKVGSTIPSHRDHYAHSVQVFLLGLAIYQQNQSFRNAMPAKTFTYKDSYPIVEEFHYRWGLTALFHDIGYPVEIAYKSTQEYARFALVPVLDSPTSATGRMPAPPIVRPVFSLNIENLDSLLYLNQLWPLPAKEKQFFDRYPDYKSFLSTDILVLLAGNLAQQFKIFEREALATMLRDYLVQGMARGHVDHGMLSAITLLKWIGTLYLQSGWNPVHFYRSAVDAAAGILLHNAYNYLFMQYPFNLEPLTPSTHPLGYLLILCDHIQETDRPAYGFYPEGQPPALTTASLSISDSEFSIQFAAKDPNDPFEKISSAAKSCKNNIERVLDLKQLFPTFDLKATSAK